jgi:hypothetical protein
MIYIKSILVGIVMAFVATILCVVGSMYILLRRYPPPPGAVEVAFDLRSISPLFWLIPVVTFGLGFYWEFRRRR